ncbi:hypothetical protein ACIQZD_23355 [Peribacillus sp. NPDC096447]|uniref:hypothetical protein n=1 Tax=Peribacillus sp. NPDC096447 TaxID=3364394 RepID=UPI003803A90E
MSFNLLLICLSVILVIWIFKIKHTMKISKLVLVSLTFSGALLGGALTYGVMAYFNFTPKVGDLSSRTDDIIKITIPLIGSFITAFSVVIATYNTSNSEKSAKRQSILDLIKFTNDIISDHDLLTESQKILKDLESKFKSVNTKVDILVNKGAYFVFEYLNGNNSSNKMEILEKLNKLNFAKDTPLDKEKEELIRLINSSDIKDMRSLWVTINALSGKPAIKYRILDKPNVYKLNNDWIGKSLKKHSFYSDTILKPERSILSDMIKENAKRDYASEFLSYDDVFRVCDVLFNLKYQKLGHFFRTTHRTIKLINQYFGEDSPEYKQQIGLLRAQIPDSVSVLLFYNAFYTERGRGMARELIASNFFGDVDDFKFINNNGKFNLSKSQHFYTKGMFLVDQNSFIIHELFAQTKQSMSLKKEINKRQQKSEPRKLSKSTKEFLNYLKSLIKGKEESHLPSEFEEGMNSTDLFLLKNFREHFLKNSTNYGEGFEMFVIDNVKINVIKYG